MSVGIYLLVVVVCCGCGRVLPPNDCQVKSIVAERIQKCAQWERCNVVGAIDYLLCQELTADSAVQIALLNNPEVQAIFDEIGIAHADLIEAGLFRNPLFEGYIRFPDQAGLVLNTQFSIAQSFLDLFLVPLRKKVAAAELEQTHLRVANAILNLSFDVQEVFYSYVAQLQKMQLLELLVEASDVTHRLAILQKEQGNINELELHARANEYLHTKVLYSENAAELVALRETMNRLMGFACDTNWKTICRLPHIPPCECSSECLEALALETRLDIGAAKWENERLMRLLKTKWWWAFADGTLGVSTEQEAENFRETGPTFSIPLPFFNYGQAERARIYSQYQQSCHRLKALEIAVLSQVRSAKSQLFIYRELVEDYESELIPLQNKILTASQHYYNYMALGVYKLIAAKKQEIEIEIQFTQALLHYWKTQVELSRALGGSVCWARNSP